MTIDYPEELAMMRTDVEKLHSLAIRLATVITDIREHLDELTIGVSPVRCEHNVPLGDLCVVCTRDRRTHCDVHDTDTVGPCPYCVESHRLDTPEG